MLLDNRDLPLAEANALPAYGVQAGELTNRDDNPASSIDCRLSVRVS